MAVNQIKLGVIISYIALFVNILIGLVYTPWLISSIGKADYGLYTLAMSIISLLAFDFGLGNATTKFVSQYLAEGRQDKVNSLMGVIYRLYLYIDILILTVLCVLYFFLPNIYTGLTSEEQDKFSTIFLIAALYCVISFPFIPQNGILSSYEKFIQLKLCDLFHKIFIVISMSGCLLLGYGLFTLVFINALSGILTILLKQWVIIRDTPLSISSASWNKGELKSIFAFTMWVTIAALAQRLIFNVAPSILGMFADSQSIAILGVAITLESYVYLFANALNGMFLPKVSRMMIDDDSNAILDLMIKVGRIQIYIIGFIVIWLVAFGNHFISVWLDKSYSLVYWCLLLIILPSFLHLPQEIGLTYTIAANKVKHQSYIYLMMGVIAIGLSIPMAKVLGVLGLCFSIFVAYLFRTILLDIMFQKQLKLNILIFFKNSYVKLFIPLFIIAIISLLINLIPMLGWVGLIVKSAIYSFAYLIIIILFGINEFEKQLFFKPIKKIIKI